MIQKHQARDLEADLAICEAAAPGPWSVVAETICTTKTDGEGWHTAIIHPRTPRPDRETMKFVASAREGWPYAIRRAMQAEDEADRLRNELQMYQERDRGRGCWD